VNHVTIHTIGFGDDGGEPLLREIAANNGGRYRFISAEESAAAAEEAGATAAAILSQLGK
jgi:hypothetical protein